MNKNLQRFFNNFTKKIIQKTCQEINSKVYDVFNNFMPIPNLIFLDEHLIFVYLFFFMWCFKFYNLNDFLLLFLLSIYLKKAEEYILQPVFKICFVMFRFCFSLFSSMRTYQSNLYIVFEYIYFKSIFFKVQWKTILKAKVCSRLC